MLSRSSQPRAGVFGSRSVKDEELVKALASPHNYVGGQYLGKVRRVWCRVTIKKEKKKKMMGALCCGHGVHGVRCDCDVTCCFWVRQDLIGKRLAICDARPFVNAVGNKGKGGGVESISKYVESPLLGTHWFSLCFCCVYLRRSAGVDVKRLLGFLLTPTP